MSFQWASSRSVVLLTAITPQTFRRRASEIADHAHNSRGALGEGVEFLRGLDETERQCMPILNAPITMNTLTDASLVFRIAHESAKDIRIWAGEAKKPK
jgi:GINS complex subunit 3